MHMQGKSLKNTELHVGAEGEEQVVRGKGVEGKKGVGCRAKGRGSQEKWKKKTCDKDDVRRL